MHGVSVGHCALLSTQSKVVGWLPELNTRCVAHAPGSDRITMSERADAYRKAQFLLTRATPRRSKSIPQWSSTLAQTPGGCTLAPRRSNFQPSLHHFARTRSSVAAVHFRTAPNIDPTPPPRNRNRTSSFQRTREYLVVGCLHCTSMLEQQRRLWLAST